MPTIPSIVPYPMPERKDLPENLAQWSISADRAVLLIHDMQRFFVNAQPESTRAELVHNVAQVRKRCATAGVPVAYTAQPGRMTQRDRGLLADFWGSGMRSDPADQEIVTELTPADGDWTFTKWRYSAFFRSDLLANMRAANRDQIILCGVYAHIGVMATAIEAFTNDIQPFLIADAVGDFSESYHRLALDYVARRCGMVVTADEVLA
jgi:trans-2,3-dihydro-3-hydroxyanthranilic acid synthase